MGKATHPQARSGVRMQPTAEAAPAPLAWVDGADGALGLFPLGLLVFWVVRVRFGKKIGDIVKQGLPGRSQSALPRI